jgi:hypothetical protein
MSDIEQTFWSVMKQLEELAVSQYQKYVPELNITQKKAFLNNIDSQVYSSNEQLSHAVSRLTKTATKNSRLDTLILQGFALELLGQGIYKAILNNDSLNQNSHHLAAQANRASQEILQQVLSIFKKENLTGDTLFKSFVSATHDVFGDLDSMAALIDETFASQSQLKFDDVLADAVTDVLKHGTDLGMDRKKLIRQLTSSLMTG